nr:hypothetical protein [Desulfobulbaceae bacterium]
MSEDINSIKIKNEDDAWEIFEQALEGAFDEHSNLELVFSNWPKIDIKLKGIKHQASLTAKNMEGLIELQNTIFRTYALAVHSKLNANKLTDDEKENLTITFQISEGSSEVVAELIKTITIFAKDMATKMEPKHYVITVLGLGLMWGGNAGLSTLLQHQKDLFVAEQQTIQKKEEIDARRFASEQEIKRMEILANAYKYNPGLEQVQESVDAMQTTLLKKLSDADEISINAVKDIQSKTVKQIFKKQREKAIDDRIDGIFRIIKVDSSNFEYFKVKVRNIADGAELSVTIKDTDITDKRKKQCLQDAEWSKIPVVMRMNIKRMRGVVVNANILNVEEVPENIIGFINEGQSDIAISWSPSKGFQYITKQDEKS